MRPSKPGKVKQNKPGKQATGPGTQNIQDPVELFRSWLQEARIKGEHEPEAMALATADAKGRPSLRMVLFKDLGPEGFYFFTNYDSRKSIELKANPHAALLFYWPGLYRQVRVEGKVRRTSPEISDAYFGTRPLGSRISACISPQSSVIPDRMFLEMMYEGFRLDLEGKEPARPSNWGGYLLVPERLEFWNGKENRLHDRIHFRRKSKGWTIEILAP
jgi:pyridoxamine 5'-phosphate oxidase